MQPRSDPDSSWLTALLAPIPAAEFLSRYWLTQYLFCRGASARFDELLSWHVFNNILAHHWRETYRFRLARQGRDLNPDSYADTGGRVPRIRANDVTEHLRRGATLSFDAVDEVHVPLTRLAGSFEAFFCGDTQINVYAACRALHGLDLHCDSEEIFILQVDGRKRWALYGPSVDHVERRELSSSSAPPPGASFDRILQAGDVLYIPKGCYHVAVPLDEPTLHLTVGIRNARATTDSGGGVKARPAFSLPWSATPALLPPGPEFLVTLHVQADLVVNDDPEAAAVEVRCGGHRYRFPRSMQWIVAALDNHAPQPIGALMDAVAQRLDEGMVRMLVGMLVKHGLATIQVPR
jgi:hypothetical protein